MKVKELIEQLQNQPADMDVCIVDYKKNTYHATGDIEGCSEGIYGKFNVELLPLDMVVEGKKQFLCIEFDSNYGEE